MKLKRLEHHTKGLDYLSFPTLTSGQTSSKMRPAGQVKCEKWFRDNGLIPNGYQLGTKAIALVMGFPFNWFEVLIQKNSKNLNIQNQPKPQAELEQDISRVEQLHQHKQPLPSAESSTSTQLLGGEDELLEHKRGERLTKSQEISIPCLVKQPNQPELRGFIQKDLGARFVVNVADKSSAYLKLFVYPDFDKSVGTLQGGLNKSSSNLSNCSSKNNTETDVKVSDTSAECSSKNNNPPCTRTNKQRRRKGEGSGHIYYRTVTRNGKDYQQAYYQWRENGKQRTKYIPKKLLKNIEEAEEQKLPVTEILDLLQGGLEKCSSNYSSTSQENVLAKEDESIETPVKCSSKNISPPCKRQKRPSGYGGGYIEYREVKRNHKVYAQYWYHWEIWQEGVRIEKKSKYIPKNKRSRVEKMNNEKIPVNKILEVLQLSR